MNHFLSEIFSVSCVHVYVCVCVKRVKKVTGLREGEKITVAEIKMPVCTLFFPFPHAPKVLSVMQ